MFGSSNINCRVCCPSGRASNELNRVQIIALQLPAKEWGLGVGMGRDEDGQCLAVANMQAAQHPKWKCPTRVRFFPLLLNRMGFSRAQRRRWCLYDDNKSRIIIFTSLFRLTFIQLFFFFFFWFLTAVYTGKKRWSFYLSHFSSCFRVNFSLLLIVCLHTRDRKSIWSRLCCGISERNFLRKTYWSV